jgi:hypothetical protein
MTKKIRIKGYKTQVEIWYNEFRRRMWDHEYAMKGVNDSMERIIKREFELVAAVKKEARDHHLNPELDRTEIYNEEISRAIKNAEEMIKKLKSLQQLKRTK